MRGYRNVYKYPGGPTRITGTEVKVAVQSTVYSAGINTSTSTLAAQAQVAACCVFVLHLLEIYLRTQLPPVAVVALNK